MMLHEGKAGMHRFTRKETRRGLQAIQDRQARHDALCREVLQEVVAEGGGLRLAAARLEDRGIDTPRPGGKWTRMTVWRICRRLGILLSAPGGLDAWTQTAPRCHRCGRQVRRFKRGPCVRCLDEAWRLKIQREIRELEREIAANPPPPLGSNATSLQASGRQKRRHPRKRFGTPVDR